MSTYQKPMVMVYQEYDSTSVSTATAQLPACIIGPCYHVVDPAEDEELALFGTYTSDGVDDAFFPNNMYGAIIDRSTVSFRFKNAMVTLHEKLYAQGTNENTVWASGEAMVDEGDVDDPTPAVTGTPLTVADGVNGNSYTVSDPSKVENVVVGDYVVFKNSEAEPTVLRVIGTNKASGTLILNRNCPNNMPIKVQRKIEEFYVQPTAVGVFLDPTSERFGLHGITYEIDGAPCTVTEAELYVGYKSLRQDLSSITTVYDVNEVRGKLGKISLDNPLAFGANIALANGSTGVKCIGITSNDLAGYTAAKDRLEQEDPVYGIVPLTFDTGILTMFKNHCEEYSVPTKSKWRMAFGCTKLTTEREICPGYGVVSRDGDGDLVVLHTDDSSIEFLSSNVCSGDIVTMTANDGTTHSYKVASVSSEDTLSITQTDPFDETLFVPGITAYKFVITHKMTKLEQAQWIAKASRAYNYCRYVNIYPDVAVVDETEVPGYYLCCAVASGVASLPSHYGMTRLSVSGFSGVKHSGDYFNNDQLDEIADGGTFIFVQSNPSSPPYIRHQLTTDVSTIEMKELSFVKNFDYVSYILRDVLDAYIGKWNITPTALAAIKTSINGTLETLKLDSQARIGSRVLDYNVVSVEQLSDVRDRVEAHVEIALPYPLNMIGLHLKSVFMQVSSSN